MLAFLLTLVAVGEADRVVVFRPVVEVTAETVTLADAVENLPPQLKDRASGVRLAELAPGASAEVSPARLLERARAQLPLLAGWSASGGPTVLLRRQPAPDRPLAAFPTACARVLRPIDGGAFVEADALEATDCGEQPVPPATWFDRPTGLARASRALSEGVVIPAPPKATLARFAPGQAFTLSATVGPVRAERPAEAVRPAADGAAVAVRDADGRIHVLEPTEGARP